MPTTHKHDWVPAERILVGGEPTMRERCACGEKRERAMTKAESAEYAEWRDEMARLDREGDHEVA